MYGRSRERRESHLVSEVRLGNRGAPDGGWNYGSLVSEASFDSNPEYGAWALGEFMLLNLSFPSITWE